MEIAYSKDIVMQNRNYEMLQTILINEQEGNPKEFELREIKNSLSEEDKYLIKNTVLSHSYQYLGLYPEELAERLIVALKKINQA